MKTIHAKSPCCGVKIYRFGNRRRQCPGCKKTWSIRQKKRGRKQIRVHPVLEKIAFASQESLRHKAKRLKKSRELIRRRHARSIDNLLKKIPKPVPPKGNLIAIIDGLSTRFKKREYTVYLILLRSIKSNKAIAMEPVFLEGHERISDWETAFNRLPLLAKKRLKAIVSDGVTGIEAYGRRQNILIQRCHFHLIKRLQTLRGKSWSTIKNKGIRENLYQKVRLLLSIHDEKKAQKIYIALKNMTSKPECPKWMGLRIRGGLRHWELFRTYRKYPELNLPTTTNSVESVWRIVSDTIRQTRSFRNTKSFEKWIKLRIRTLNSITCNGNNYQQN
ncbi:hypothetical protein CL633_01380 [bacterium]|nr:hypothetical protein [bacterium]|tara:strand:+ start:1116 stop:2111 length:996 start_codon:yes stop_codon:yes gene_type:complete